MSNLEDMHYRRLHWFQFGKSQLDTGRLRRISCQDKNDLQDKAGKMWKQEERKYPQDKGLDRLRPKDIRNQEDRKCSR